MYTILIINRYLFWQEEVKNKQANNETESWKKKNVTKSLAKALRR